MKKNFQYIHRLEMALQSHLQGSSSTPSLLSSYTCTCNPPSICLLFRYAIITGGTSYTSWTCNNFYSLAHSKTLNITHLRITVILHWALIFYGSHICYSKFHASYINIVIIIMSFLKLKCPSQHHQVIFVYSSIKCQRVYITH